MPGPASGEATMMGIVFNLLEACVSEAHGEDTWDDLLDAAGLDGAFTSLERYSDDDLFKLVEAAAAALGLTTHGVQRWFGQAAMPKLAARYPEFFAPHQQTRSFVLTLNAIIHPEVRKLYPGAGVPVFDYREGPPELLQLDYRSARRMCGFAEGLIAGAATHFGERVQIEQPRCMHRGDELCTLQCRFEPERGDG